LLGTFKAPAIGRNIAMVSAQLPWFLYSFHFVSAFIPISNFDFLSQNSIWKMGVAGS
jgi:hypothetical protein